MKKSIEMPIVNVVRFEAKDVITTSCELKKGDASTVTGSKATVRIAESKSFGGGVSFSSAW